jgi:protein O-mannosyl-transferase
MAAKNKQQVKQATAKTPVSKPKPVAAPLRTSTFLPGFWRNHWMPAVLLMVMAFGLYGASISFGYMLDDQMVIWANTYVQKGFGGLKEIFAYDSFMGYFQKEQFLLEGGRYRPLSLATFAAEIGIFGKDNPNLIHVSHFVNILLYGVTGILLYRILLGLFPVKEGGRWYFGVPFLASALFVLHPLHSECVANIKGRDEILALLGSLAALYATLKYFDTQRTLWMILSGVFLLLGVLAKENALTFIAVIPLTVLFFTNVSGGRNASASLPLLLAGLLFILLRYKALGYMLNHGNDTVDLMNNPFLGMTGGERIATIFLTLGWYVKLLFVPHPLTHDYYPYHVPKVNWSDWRALLSLALYVGMGVWAVLNLKNRKVPAYTILFYLFTLSIVSNLFVSVGTFMNERFLYMPSVGFCILIGWFFARKLPELIKEGQDKPSILGAMLVLVVAALFAVRTVTRVPDWETPMSLNTVAVEVSENSARAHCYYVTALYKDRYVNIRSKDKSVKGPLVDTMEYHINRSLQINPNYGAALIMKGAVAAARFDVDNQLDKFFHEMEYIIEKIPYNPNFRDFLDKYMDYLNGSNADKYMAFCHRVGYDFFFKKKNDLKTAEKFLIYGLNRQYEDIRILDDLTEVYTAMGNPAKAAEMKARADAQR